MVPHLEIPYQEVLKPLPLSDGETETLSKGKIVRNTSGGTDDRELAVGRGLLHKQTPETVRDLFREAVEFKLTGAVTAEALAKMGRKPILRK